MRQIEMERRQQAQIQRHAEIEIELYRSFLPQSESTIQTPATFGGDTASRLPGASKCGTNRGRAAGRKAKRTIPDGTRLEILKMKARDRNATQIRRKFGISPILSEASCIV
jgi:hypothetical protein